jgi:hypothetical protein
MARPSLGAERRGACLHREGCEAGYKADPAVSNSELNASKPRIGNNAGRDSMDLRDSLRKAEERGRDATRRVLGHARDQWEDAERRIRAGMRIHPRPKSQSSTTKSSFAVQSSEARLNSADPELDKEPASPNTRAKKNTAA